MSNLEVRAFCETYLEAGIFDIEVNALDPVGMCDVEFERARFLVLHSFTPLVPHLSVQGKALIFWSRTPQGTEDPCSLHGKLCSRVMLTLTS